MLKRVLLTAALSLAAGLSPVTSHAASITYTAILGGENEVPPPVAPEPGPLP